MSFPGDVLCQISLEIFLLKPRRRYDPGKPRIIRWRHSWSATVQEFLKTSLVSPIASIEFEYFTPLK
jgi:hypothetical protein